MAAQDVTAFIAEVNRVVDYDKATGVFRWRINRGKVKAGSVAGKRNTAGHVQIPVFRQQFLAHRLAWLIITGEWPKGDLDHINTTKDDNRFQNLREATRTQNLANRDAPKHNTSGFKGVSWHKRQRKWNAYISVDRRRISLGSYDSAYEASQAHAKAAKTHFGEFARL